MIWSISLMSNNSPAAFIFLVMFLSASLGVGFPLGWLCDIIIPVAKVFIAVEKIKRKSTTVAVSHPVLKG